VLLAFVSMPLAMATGLTAALVRSYPNLTLVETRSTPAAYRLLNWLCTV
jgi:hypothetical protein